MQRWIALSKKRLSLCAVSLLVLGGCSGGPSTSDRIRELITASESARQKGDVETSIPSAKMACELALGLKDHDQQTEDLQRKTYDESIKVADALNGFGRLKAARDVLKNAALLEKSCGIPPDSTDSAVQKLAKLDQAEVRESEIFEDAASTQSAMPSENDSYLQRQKVMSKVWDLAKKKQYAQAETLAREFLKERSKVLDHLNDLGYRHALTALESIYIDQKRYREVMDMYSADAAAQKREYSKTDLDQADPAAFYKARYISADLVKVASMQLTLNDPESALKTINQIEDIARKVGQKGELFPCLMLKSQALEGIQNYSAAIPYRKECIRLVSDAKGPINQYVENLQRLAFDYEQLNQFNEALKTHKSICKALQDNPQIELAASVVIEAAIVAQRAKNYELRDNFIQQSKELLSNKVTRPPHAWGHYYMTLGNFYREGGEYGKAIPCFKKAQSYLAQSKVQAWHEGAADALLVMALCFSKQQQHREALSTLDHYFKIHHPTTPQAKLAYLESLVLYAQLTRDAGLLGKAVERHEAAIDYMQRLDRLPPNFPDIYFNAAYEAKRLEVISDSKCSGSNCKSERLVQSAIEAVRKSNLPSKAMAHLLYRIGTMYYDFEQYDTAIKYLDQSLSEWKKLEGTTGSQWRPSESDCLRYLGVAEWRSSKNYAKAKQRFTDAIDVLRNGQRSLLTSFWALMAMVSLDEEMAKGDAKLLLEADDYARKACDLLKDTPYKFEYVIALCARAKVNIELAQLDDAEKLLQTARQTMLTDKVCLDTQQLSTCLALEAHVALKKHKIDQARTLLHQGISHISKIMERKLPPDCAIATIALARVCRKAGLTKESTQLQQQLRKYFETQTLSEATKERRLADCADNKEY